jgi:hypothetical protein
MYIAFWLPALGAGVMSWQEAILRDSIARM